MKESLIEQMSYAAASEVAHVAQTIGWFAEGAFDPQGSNMDFEAHDKAVRAVTSIDDARALFMWPLRTP